MQQYLDALRKINEDGRFYDDRTKVGRRGVFGIDMRFDLRESFPLLTSKFTPIGAITKELLFFIKGENNITEMAKAGCNIWNEWAVTEEHVKNPSDAVKRVIGDDSDFGIDYRVAVDELRTKIGTIGPLYGVMWRNAPGGGDLRVPQAIYGDNHLEAMIEEMAPDKMKVILDKHGSYRGADFERDVLQAYYKVDQLQQLMLNLKRIPHSSRHVITAWLPELIPDERLSPQDNVLMGRQALAPCHCMFQFWVEPSRGEGQKKRLSCKLTQRSADFFLGVPFNIASYAMLTMMIAQCVDMEPGELIWSGGDCHIYSNQQEQVDELLTRTPLPAPTLAINPDVKSIYDFQLEDFVLKNYQHHPAIKAKVAV